MMSLISLMTSLFKSTYLNEQVFFADEDGQIKNKDKIHEQTPGKHAATTKMNNLVKKLQHYQSH